MKARSGRNGGRLAGEASAGELPLTGHLPSDLAAVREMLGGSTDVVFREFVLGTKRPFRAALIYVEGLVDAEMIGENVLRALLRAGAREEKGEALTTANALTVIEDRILSLGAIQRRQTVDQVVESALLGDAVLLVAGSTEALALGTKGGDKRAVTQPDTEVVVRGSREGFVENLSVNTALLRRRIRNPELTMENLVLGRRTKTRVVLAYLKGVAAEELVGEVRNRLNRIASDCVLESGYVEQFIEDAPFSPFSTVGNSEKPDVVAAKLLEGRVAIFTDGTPIALTVPFLFVESFQTPEDYYSRPYYASLIRLSRHLSFWTTVLAPALYVALLSFHQELIPTPLLLNIAATKRATPFPSVAEALGMGAVFEILREAGVRMPRPVGQAVSIVGALVIGQSAVTAGLISPLMVIVVALTAIASFVAPPLLDASIILRFTLLVLAAILGAFGLVIGLLGALVHLTTLRSFGAPYLSPLAPLSPGEVLRDVFFRAPLWLLTRRPRVIGWKNPQRQAPGQMPAPPGGPSQGGSGA